MTGAEVLVAVCAAMAAIAGAVVELRRLGHDQSDVRDRLARVEERQVAMAADIGRIEQRLDSDDVSCEPDTSKDVQSRKWWWPWSPD